MLDVAYRLAGVTMIVAALLLGGVAAAHAEESQIFISVLDENGMPLTDLAPGDVILLQNGEVRKTVSLTRVTAPLRVSLMIDNSESTREILRQIQEGAELFLKALPDGAEVELIAIGGRARQVERRTTNREDLLGAVFEIAPDSGSTKYIESLREALSRYERLAEDDEYQWPHIVMVVGNGTESSNTNVRNSRRVLEGLIDLPATVHTLFLRVADVANQGIVQSDFSLVFKDTTGGQYETASVGGTIPPILERFAQELGRIHAAQSSQYVLVFEQPDGAEGGLQIQLNRPDARSIQASGDGRVK